MPRSPEMQAPSSPDETPLRRVTDHLRAEVTGLALVYLFGSEAGGAAHAESDLDVAFLADASPPAMERFTVQEDLARMMGRDVDLVDLRAASTVMRAEVVRTGCPLFERSPGERDRFEMHACSAYALLNEERRAILGDIRRRGTVYGSAPSGSAPSGSAPSGSATPTTMNTTMASDVVLNKAATIERCLQRVRAEYAGDPVNLRGDITRQDAIILNLQRACQASIDLATHLARARELGVPQTSRDAFEALVEHGMLEEELGTRLERMVVGFRNVAIHDYQRLSLDVVQAIIDDHLGDFEAFAQVALRLEDLEDDES